MTVPLVTYYVLLIRKQIMAIHFVPIKHRLHNITSIELKDSGASWHRDCYKKAISHIDRDKARATKASSSNDLQLLTRKRKGRPSLQSTPEVDPAHCAKRATRGASDKPRFDKNKCLFCQNDTTETVISCQSNNKGHEILRIVENSANELWNVQLADVVTSGDLLSKDIVYHKSCDTKHWEKYVQRPKLQSTKATGSAEASDSETHDKLNRIAAGVQFYALVQEQIDDGQILNIPDLQITYEKTLDAYDINYECDTSYIFKNKLLRNLNSVNVTCSPGKSTKIHSDTTGTKAIHEAANTHSKSKSKMQLVYGCAQYLRSTLLNSKCMSWVFDGCLEYPPSDIVPEELTVFVKWLIHGPKTSQSGTRDKGMNRSATVLSQQILQHMKSDRQTVYSESKAGTFYASNETPLAVGLSLQSHHTHRSRNTINILSAASVGIPYNHVQKITNQIVDSTLTSMRQFGGTYVPPFILKGLPIRASVDNLDNKVDTPNGQNSFHGTVSSVYQSIKKHTNAEPLRENLSINGGVIHEDLSDVPETVIDLIQCNIEGNPKPKRSPRFENYDIGQNKPELTLAQSSDLMCLIARYVQRADIECTVQQVNMKKQTIPVWRAYNSLVSIKASDSSVKDMSHTLPIINAPAHDWPTLVTVLDNLYKLNEIVCPGTDSKVMVTFDMDIYKRALKLEFLDESYSGKWWLLPGPFHTSLCAIRCLGRTIEHSGIDDMWIKAGVYSEVVTNQIITGSHYNRAVDAHEITLQLFTDLWLEAFFEGHPHLIDSIKVSVHSIEEAVKSGDQALVKTAHQAMLIEIEEMNLEKQLDEFDQLHDKYPMYKWCRIYMRQVMSLLAFHRSIKDQQLLLYLASLEELATYFFAYNRLDYAQHILEFAARAYDAKTSAPDVWSRLCDGEFSFSKNNIPFTAIGMDQAQEHQNKVLKGEGGLSGITNKPATFLKFCLASPELSNISQKTNEMLGLTKQETQKHHQLSTNAAERQAQTITVLKAKLNFNPFKDKGNNLYSLMSKQVLRAETKISILETVKRGVDAKLKFVDERIRGQISLWDRMTKVKYLGWNDLQRKPKVNENSRMYHMKSTTSLLSRMLVVAKSDRSLDLQSTVSSYEFLEVNHTLMNDDGTLLRCLNKSELIHALETLGNIEEDVSSETLHDTRHLIIDGMAIVQAILHVGNITDCQQLASSVSNVIDGLLQKYFCGRVIFDNYNKTMMIKDMIRYKGNTGDDLLIDDTTPLNGNHDIMSNNKTKDRPTLYLARKLIELSHRNIVTVTRSGVYSNNSDIQPTTGASTQEEADTLMMLHALEIVESGASVDFFTQDTDWFVLTLQRFPRLGHRPGIVTGTRESRRQVELTSIFKSLGEEKAAALPGMHVLTGTDTTGHISGIGKRRALKALLNSEDSVVTSLSMLGACDNISESEITGCIEYLCKLASSRQTSSSDPGKLRWKKFKLLSSAVGVEKLPPTYGSWYQHILRAHLQARIWYQDTELNPSIPDPLMFGWENDGLFEAETRSLSITASNYFHNRISKMWLWCEQMHTVVHMQNE